MESSVLLLAYPSLSMSGTNLCAQALDKLGRFEMIHLGDYKCVSREQELSHTWYHGTKRIKDSDLYLALDFMIGYASSSDCTECKT